MPDDSLEHRTGDAAAHGRPVELGDRQDTAGRERQPDFIGRRAAADSGTACGCCCEWTIDSASSVTTSRVVPGRIWWLFGGV